MSGSNVPATMLPILIHYSVLGAGPVDEHQLLDNELIIRCRCVGVRR